MRTLHGIRGILLDLDGVVYIENRLLPRVRTTVARLRERGLRIFFVTNNAETTRAGFARRLSRLGIPCSPEQIMNAAFAAAGLLKHRFPHGSSLFVFGNNGLARELAAAGFRPQTVRTRAQWIRFRSRSGEKIRAVVTGFNRALTYWGLCAAHRALTRGATLVACNHDSTYPVRDGTLPGTGSVVRLLEVSSGRRSLLVGKPSPSMFELLLRENGIEARQTLVVGDRLEIDIAAGRAAGARTALVLTGISRRSHLKRSRFKPDFVLRELADLLPLLA